MSAAAGERAKASLPDAKKCTDAVLAKQWLFICLFVSTQDRLFRSALAGEASRRIELIGERLREAEDREGA